ncbi:MAG: hypothetical protein HY078_17000 [Elusimicrobia bacterium]|nr:hypothetical protein [Elusimicrobiota bacterium]
MSNALAISVVALALAASRAAAAPEWIADAGAVGLGAEAIAVKATIAGPVADDHVAIGRLLKDVKDTVSAHRWDELFDKFGCTAAQRTNAERHKPTAIASLIGYWPPTAKVVRPVTAAEIDDIRTVEFRRPQAQALLSGAVPDQVGYEVPGRAILVTGRSVEIYLRATRTDGRYALVCPLP